MVKKNLFCGVIAGMFTLFLALNSTPVFADDDEEKNIPLSTLSNAELKGILEYLEESDILDYVEESENGFLVKKKGVKIIFMLDDEGEVLTVMGFFGKDRDIPLSKINEWNQNKNFGRAYISDDDYLVFQDELTVEGSSIGNLIFWIVITTNASAEFAEFF